MRFSCDFSTYTIAVQGPMRGKTFFKCIHGARFLPLTRHRSKIGSQDLMALGSKRRNVKIANVSPLIRAYCDDTGVRLYCSATNLQFSVREKTSLRKSGPISGEGLTLTCAKR